MKILLINFTDAGGGAATAALRLTIALNNAGIYARLGVGDKKTSSSYVIELPKKKKPLIQKILKKISNYTSTVFSPVTKHFKKRFSTTNGILHTDNFKSETDINWINNSDFDVVNLHWINGTICNKDIARITKPIVWTMHDSWPCCGAEHHPNIFEGDTRWQTGYTKINKPVTTKGEDYCRKVWLQKKKYLSDKKIIFTAPSKWEHDILKSSALFGHSECHVIPNIIPSKEFFSRNKKALREAFNIPQDKIVLGFGAAYDIDNPKSMKGSYYLIEAIKKIKNPEKYFLVIFGPAGDAFTSRINIPFFASGYISNPNILASIYSTCDIVINPSLIENLPTTCLESIFCGVPVVAFNVGGTSDIVEHQKTGYLAEPYSTDRIVEGIEYCVKNNQMLSDNCLKKAKKDFNENEIIKNFISLFQDNVKNKDRQ